jgi:hypothetical protein
VFNSGVRNTAPGGPASPQPGSDALPKLHGPVLLINGGEPDFMMATSAATFDLIDRVLHQFQLGRAIKRPQEMKSISQTHFPLMCCASFSFS